MNQHQKPSAEAGATRSRRSNLHLTYLIGSLDRSLRRRMSEALAFPFDCIGLQVRPATALHSPLIPHAPGFSPPAFFALSRRHVEHMPFAEHALPDRLPAFHAAGHCRSRSGMGIAAATGLSTGRLRPGRRLHFERHIDNDYRRIQHVPPVRRGAT
ncbi:hypothetical protein OKW40_005930 [Paraburkholderia sp. RAU6.4a]|uniref:hypothetical protein n=1 Tax=Paraburkholderia sp. RAU6.4a TaxID=2991067 RepID=UPI003D1A1D5B